MGIKTWFESKKKKKKKKKALIHIDRSDRAAIFLWGPAQSGKLKSQMLGQCYAAVQLQIVQT